MKGELLRGEGLTPVSVVVMQTQSFNPFPPRPAKTRPFVILLQYSVCLKRQTILLVKGKPLGGKGLILWAHTRDLKHRTTAHAPYSIYTVYPHTHTPSDPDFFAHLCIVNKISIYVKISYLDVQFYDVGLVATYLQYIHTPEGY